MMRKFLILSSVLLSFPLLLAAQTGVPSTAFGDDAPRTTIFGGYSYLRNHSNGFNGWEGQGTYNFTPHLGVTADVSGDYRTATSFSLLGVSASANQHLYTYLFGPTVTTNLGRSAVFAHALFGQAHSSLGAGVSLPIVGGISSGITSANAFAMAFGGGVDIGVSPHVSIRAAQVDYLRTQFSATDSLATGLSSSLNNGQNSFRYSAGIVFRF
jgi:opacity protein-like surface antigen